MALSHTDLEMVTVRGVTFLVDPSTFVEGCTYLLVGSGTVEPFDSVPIPSAALLLNLGRGGSTPEERQVPTSGRPSPEHHGSKSVCS